MKKKTIFLTGGGTGGHIIPLIPIIKSLKSRYRLVYVGQKGGEEERIAKEEGIKFASINCAKLQGLSFLNPFTWINQLRGISQSLKLIKLHKPVLVFAKGGYVSFPLSLASYIKGVRLIIHESDSVIGRANKLLNLITLRLLVGFPKQVYPKKFWSKMISVGIPTRSEFVKTDFPNHFQVLFMGGSQGSAYLNHVVKKTLTRLAEKTKVVHLCGRDNISEMEKFRASLPSKIKDKYELIGYSDDIAKLIKDSTLVVSRSGATSLVEIAKISRPVILVPFPHAAGNHQLKNARIVKSKGGAEIVEQGRKSHIEIEEKILTLLKNLKKRHQLADNLTKFMAINSTSRIKKIINSISNEEL